MRHNVTRAQTSAGTRFAGASPQVPQCHRASLQVIYMQGADSSGRSGTWHRLIRKVRQERAQTYPEGQAHGTNSSGGSGTSAISQRAMAIHVHFFVHPQAHTKQVQLLGLAHSIGKLGGQASANLESPHPTQTLTKCAT